MKLPGPLRAVLPADAVHVWETLAPALPKQLYLGGGTALAVHIHHRESRDLDLFYHRHSVDLGKLARQLHELGEFAVVQEGPGTLNGIFSETRVQFLHADERSPQRRLEPTVQVAGLNVAGVGDILAMKLKVIPERSELRDYFDLKAIELRTGRTVEEGLSLFLARYDLEPTNDALQRIVQALGYLDDVDEDRLVPESKAQIARYWRRRHPEIIQNLAEFAD